ncbi:MAG TPA: hypothetical protein VM261_30215 [Kofleriaceae bacterium]|nr:hypothetical protein [Kofleriaceae bacterium]
MDRVERALGLSAELADGERLPARPAAARRAVAIGDPQAHAHKLFAVLDHHGLLGDDGRLRDDVQLVSIGDHFDFGTRAQGTTAAARVDGARFLRWLCAHPVAQTTVLVGNHDTARVMELATVTDARFDAAAALAGELIALEETAPDEARARTRDEYMVAFPEVPALGVVHRDFSAFTEAQRALVQRELMSGRLRLAASGRAASGNEVLLTHAGVTARELALLGVPEERAASFLSAALAAKLAAAVDDVRARWSAGENVAMSLEPLHVAGATAADGLDGLPEGGGMLYHRPADPDRPGADRTWENEVTRPRRYHPRTLPAGLVQVAGHTGHPKCVAELIRWRDPAMEETLSGRRTLRVSGDVVEYSLGIHAPHDGDAVLYMIDPSFHRAADPAAVELFELAPDSVV